MKFLVIYCPKLLTYIAIRTIAASKLWPSYNKDGNFIICIHLSEMKAFHCKGFLQKNMLIIK
jgi:hypothetical protein